MTKEGRTEGAWRWLLVAAGIITAGLLILAMLASPDPSSARQGGQGGAVEYDYKVTGLDYNAHASMTGAKGQGGCVAGVTSVFEGKVDSSDPEVTPLDHGRGDLQIGRHGSDGSFHATSTFDFNFTDAKNDVTTDCDTGADTQSSCTDKAPDLEVQAEGSINGGVGDKTKVDWNFEVNNKPSTWVPNTFECAGQTELFTGDAQCRSNKALSLFTEKKFKLFFRCFDSDTVPPKGSGYDLYGAASSVKGFVELKRTGVHHG